MNIPDLMATIGARQPPDIGDYRRQADALVAAADAVWTDRSAIIDATQDMAFGRDKDM
jgi:hypothetical protein